MKRVFLIVCATLYAVCIRAGEVPVASPDGKLVATISIHSEGIAWEVKKERITILPASPLGLVVNNLDLSVGTRMSGKTQTREIDENYPIHGNHPVAHNRCREITIPLRSGGIAWRLQVRAYDDGIAVRYLLDVKKPVKIGADLTGWNLPDNSSSWWSDYTIDYEELHRHTTVGEIPSGKVLTVPFTAQVNGQYISLSEADCRTFPDMGLRAEAGQLQAVFPANPRGWTTSAGAVVSPWRAMIVADDLTALVNSDLITNLCDAPAAERNFSWVKPGRVLWQWWSVAEPKYEEQKAWYDAAARLGWEYYLIDDGWRVWSAPGKDQWQCLKEVIDYGKSKGVETIIWVNSNEMRTRDSIRIYLEKVKPLGAVGVKIDFIPACTPEVTRWYQDALEETYNFKLMCNFHGCVKPSGLRRTWPHELTREAVRGHEFHISRYDRVMPKEQNTIKPFTRYLAGPADFTPTAFVPTELLGYTWPNELAQAIVFLSPLTHFCDQYKYYLNSPVEDLLRDVPVVWDQTLVLPGSCIGKIAAFARRNGDEWWIGILNGASEEQISFGLDFLPGAMMATEITDREGVDDAVVRSQKVLKPQDTISLTLRPGGGYVLRLQPIR